MWHRLLGMLYKQWHRKLSQDMYTNINAKYLLPLEVYYILCLLHGFPCRIYLLAHYAFVASKIRMVPQGNEINISNSAILLPISRPTSWQTLLILQDPTIINVNY